MPGRESTAQAQVRGHLPHGYLRIIGRKSVPGRIVSVAEVLSEDEAPGGARHRFLESIRRDPQRLKSYGSTFRNDGQLMSAAEAAKDYQERVNVGPRHRITDESATMCTDFFDFGAIKSRTGAEVVIEVDGESVTVDDSSGRDGERMILPWDETHDDDYLDDLTLLNAFSEAPLLRTLRRRFLALDNIRIYTYVGDILIALNP